MSIVGNAVLDGDGLSANLNNGMRASLLFDVVVITKLHDSIHGNHQLLLGDCEHDPKVVCVLETLGKEVLIKTHLFSHILVV